MLVRRLNYFGRGLLITRVLEEGWTAAAAAEAAGVSRATVYKWLARYRGEGRAGLHDRSSCPLQSPRRLTASTEQQILLLRRQRKLGPHPSGGDVGRGPLNLLRGPPWCPSRAVAC
jgi:hypothetical protein